MKTEFIVTEKRWRHHFPHSKSMERSWANNSVVKSPTQPKFELIRDFMPVLVICKFDKDPIKGDWKKRGDNVSTSIWQLELSVAMVTIILIRSASKPNAAFPPTPKMLLVKFDWTWLTGLGDIIVRKCGRRTMTTDDRALLYYKLTLWALGSGELKTSYAVPQVSVPAALKI